MNLSEAIKEEAARWIPLRLERLCSRLQETGAGAALLTSHGNLRYLAGYEAPIEWGVSPFAPCSSLLILIPGRPPELLLAEGEALDPVPSGLGDLPLSRLHLSRAHRYSSCVVHLCYRATERNLQHGGVC